MRTARGGMSFFEKLVKEQQVSQSTGELLAPKEIDERKVHMLNVLLKSVMVGTVKNDRETTGNLSVKWRTKF